jgi:uncharacterized protein (UPF0261 family)
MVVASRLKTSRPAGLTYPAVATPGVGGSGGTDCSVRTGERLPIGLGEITASCVIGDVASSRIDRHSTAGRG